MAKFSWRSFIWSTLTASSVLTGIAPQSQACCLSFFGGSWGGCCGGSYGTGYYGGYAPFYGNYQPAYGYGAAYGYGPAYAYGDAYASAGYGCSSCVGGECGIEAPVTNPTRPVPDRGPDDGYRRVPGSNLNDPPAGTRPPRRRAPARETNPANTLPDTTRPGTNERNDGFGVDPSRAGAPADLGTEEEGGTGTFRRPRTPSGTERDPFDNDRDANKPPMPDGEDRKPREKEKENETTIPPVEDNSFGEGEEDEASTGVKVQRPDLGSASETDSPADASEASGAEDPQGIVIPQKKPAPIEIPAPEEAAPEPNLPEDLQELDEKPTSAGVSPKVRLARRGGFGTPSIVRIKIRPNRGWQPTPDSPVVARH